jgi:hypothetical protein
VAETDSLFPTSEPIDGSSEKVKNKNKKKMKELAMVVSFL